MSTRVRTLFPPVLLALVSALVLLLAAQPSGAQLSVHQLTSLLVSQWRAGQRSGRTLGAGQLLANSELIVTPKLEITSPTVPKDGGTLYLYVDIPFSLGGLGAATSLFSERNDSVTSSPPAVPSPPSPSPPRPPAAGDAPIRPPAPPPSDYGMGNPMVIKIKDRQEGWSGGRSGDRPGGRSDGRSGGRSDGRSGGQAGGGSGGQGREGRSDEDVTDVPLTLSTSSGFHDAALLMLKKMGMDGHACLLRAVCELSARPLRYNGLMGDLINAVAEIPSTSDRVLEEELKVSRQLGLRGAPCPEVFDNCDNFIINKLAK